MNYSLGNIISNGGVLKRLDPDAAAFIAATGATDVANINAWVLGLKSQGIWNNIVCWPMRSTQNHGGVTTVLRSLGGLGSFNGTLVNGPTWGANGITRGSSTSIITISPVPPQTAGVSAGAYFRSSGPGNEVVLRWRALEIASFISGFDTINDSNQNVITQVASSGSTFRGLGFSTNGSTGTINARGFLNGVFVSQGTDLLSSTITSASMMNGVGISLANLQQSLVWMANAQFSDATMLNIHALYRTTLGAGLGLP